MSTRTTLLAEARAIAQAASDENRRLTADEQSRFQALNERVDQLAGYETRTAESEAKLSEIAGRPVTGSSARSNPLAFTSQALDAVQAAIDSRGSARVAADLEERAALATTTFGAPRVWGSNVLDGPRMLHVAAGVPQQPADAVLAQFPVLTLPTAIGSVGENVSLAEYAASTAGSTTMARFGRWTDLSREALIGADAGAIVGMHQVGVALDLDNALISAVNTAAGGAVAFTADVPAAIRKSIAVVTAAVAVADASNITVLCHPDNVALLESVTPIGGSTIGEGFSRFSGALVYPSTAVPTGFMLVGALGVGCRFFSAQTLSTETHIDVKTGTQTVATSVIAGYGVGLTTGFAQKIDVITP